MTTRQQCMVHGQCELMSSAAAKPPCSWQTNVNITLVQIHPLCAASSWQMRGFTCSTFWLSLRETNIVAALLLASLLVVFNQDLKPCVLIWQINKRLTKSWTTQIMSHRLNRSQNYSLRARAVRHVAPCMIVHHASWIIISSYKCCTAMFIDISCNFISI